VAINNLILPVKTYQHELVGLPMHNRRISASSQGFQKLPSTQCSALVKETKRRS